ncbi:MAG: class I adenylate-forming enzyme family protein [Betaproteobacteria bacterium]
MPTPPEPKTAAPHAAIGRVYDRQSALAKRFPAWAARTLDQTLDAAAAEFPTRPYLITDTQTWTYSDIQAWSERLAAGLLAAGVQPGDHVAMLMANHPEFVAVKFAISRVGAVAVPINFLNRRDELAYVLRQSDAVLLVTMDSFRGLDYLGFLDELAPGWATHGGGAAFPRLKQVVVFPASGQPLRAGAKALSSLGDGAAPWQAITHPGPASNSDIIYTSGTTGSPKGVMLSHDMMLRAAFGSAWGRAFEDGRRVLFSLPMYHVYGYVEGLLSVLFVGGAIVPRLKFDAVDTLEAVPRHSVNDLLLIPTMTLALIDELKARPYGLDPLHAVLSSGGRSPAYIWQDIVDHLRPLEITTGYGMTEVTASSTVTRPDDPMSRLLTTNGRLRDVGPAGVGGPDGKLVVYRVVDPATGQDVALGEIGELLARGPGVTAGYYNKPEATAEAFTADGWLLTGDLARMDAEGYLTLAGRRKESYRCGGEQVLPSDAEDLLATHPAVWQAYVVPLPDERMGEVGVACVVLREQANATPAELTAFCAQSLARFKVPRHVLLMKAEDIPVTPSGRARKFLLLARVTELLGLA